MFFFFNGCPAAIWGASQRGDSVQISIFRLTKNFELLPWWSMTVTLWVTTLIFSKKFLPGREKCVPDTHFETSPGTKKWLPRPPFFCSGWMPPKFSNIPPDITNNSSNKYHSFFFWSHFFCSGKVLSPISLKNTYSKLRAIFKRGDKPSPPNIS